MSRWRAFLHGAGSLLDFQGALVPEPLSDEEALARAWNEVGGLISNLYNQIGPPPARHGGEATDPRKNR